MASFRGQATFFDQNGQLFAVFLSDNFMHLEGYKIMQDIHMKCCINGFNWKNNITGSTCVTIRYHHTPSKKLIIIPFQVCEL